LRFALFLWMAVDERALGVELYNVAMSSEARCRRAPIERPEMRELHQRSDAAGIARLAGHLVALVVAGALVALAPVWPFRVPAQALEGAVLVFLFAPLHETVHRTAFRNRRLNAVVSEVIGFLLVLPAGYFRYFHFAHHRYTQDPVRDPELASPKPATLRQWFWVLTGLPVWREHVLGVLRHAVGRVSDPYLTPIQARRVVVEARVHLALYAAVAVASIGLGSDAALRYWLIPALLGQPWLRAFLMAEHTGCPLVPDMLHNSRTTLTHGFVRYFAWNMPFHSEHHSDPAVPFHALPKLHLRLAPFLGKTARGYLAAQREIVKGLR
jgi:fatty acid desaturase